MVGAAVAVVSEFEIFKLQVSAGYDAHWRDPLASLQMRSSTYYRLAAKIKALADSLSGGPTCLYSFECKT